MSNVITLKLSPADLAIFVAGLYKQGVAFTVKQESHTYHFIITGY